MKSLPSILAVVGGSYIFGAERISLDVFTALKKKGYCLNVIINGWNDGKFSLALKQEGIAFHELKLGWYYLHKIRWSLDSLVHYPVAVLKFIMLRKKIRPDILYILTYRQLALLWPFINEKIIYHVHDLNSASKQSSFFIKKIDKKIACYIAVSDLVKQDLTSLGIAESKIKVIHNGTMWIEELPKRRKNDCLVIGLVGQVIERKGHLQALKCIKLLKNKNIELKLKIVGNGDAKYERILKEFIKENEIEDYIEWSGNKSGITEIYDGIDVLLAPTISEEPFGLIAIEANMLSIPVIASNKGGFKETILNDFNGFLVDVMDIPAIADKIELFYNDPARVLKMGANGRVHVQRNFTTEIMNERIHSLIQSLTTQVETLTDNA